jgi:Antibiotic biosynthesis monooxygenase
LRSSTQRAPSLATLAFDAYRSFRDPNAYVLLERYGSRDALAAHRATPHFQEIVIEQLVRFSPIERSTSSTSRRKPHDRQLVDRLHHPARSAGV